MSLGRHHAKQAYPLLPGLLSSDCFDITLHLSHLSLVPPSRCTSFDCLHGGEEPNCCLKMHEDSGRLQVVLHSTKDFGPEPGASMEADALQKRESIVKSISADDENDEAGKAGPWEIKLCETGVALVPVRNLN